MADGLQTDWPENEPGGQQFRYLSALAAGFGPTKDRWMAKRKAALNRMAGDAVSPSELLARLKGLTDEQQDAFVRLCLDDSSNNAVKAWIESFERQIAIDDIVADERQQDAFDQSVRRFRERENVGREIKRLLDELKHNKRKPSSERDDEVKRLREIEKLSFGQIAKRLGLKSEATARQRYNRALRHAEAESVGGQLWSKLLGLPDADHPHYAVLRKEIEELNARLAKLQGK